MAKPKDIDDKPAVDAFMATVEHPLKAEVESLRLIIRGASNKLNERVKWNAPSYFIGKSDFAAFNLHQQAFVQLIVVFPKGKPPIDIDGLTEGTWPDRRMIAFKDATDIKKKTPALERLIKQWVELATA